MKRVNILKVGLNFVLPIPCGIAPEYIFCDELCVPWKSFVKLFEPVVSIDFYLEEQCEDYRGVLSSHHDKDAIIPNQGELAPMLLFVSLGYTA